MDLIRKSIPDELLKVAIPPNPEGTEELAWPVSMAKRIIAYVYMGKLAVLGGDIYVKDGSQLNPAYDNW